MVGCYVLGWLFTIVVQVLVPLAAVIFPILAPFAFLTKMESLPNPKEFDHWTPIMWVNFIGVLNQTGKLWHVNSVEQRAVLRMMRGEVGCKPGKLIAEISSAAVEELGWRRATVFMVNLDSSTLESIFGEFLMVFKRRGDGRTLMQRDCKSVEDKLNLA